MKAVNRQTGVWYAVKMIKDKTNRGVERGQIRNSTIAREIAIMEKLKHKNICELKEVFLEDGCSDISKGPCFVVTLSLLIRPNLDLVLELVEGGDLLEYILNRGGLSAYHQHLPCPHSTLNFAFQTKMRPSTSHISYAMLLHIFTDKALLIET